VRGERVSNENHKANSLAVQYCSKNIFILGITTVTANSNQQNPPLKASMGSSYHTRVLMHSIRRVYAFRAVRRARKAFESSGYTRVRQALNRHATSHMSAIGMVCSPQASRERGLSEIELCLASGEDNLHNSSIS